MAERREDSGPPRRGRRAAGARDLPRRTRLSLGRRNRGTTLAGVPGNPIFPPVHPAFELHGETFDLPPGALLLAPVASVRHQAFSIGSALGLQFHLGATPGMIAAWATGLAPTGSDCRSAETARYAKNARRLCVRVLDYVLRA